MKEYLKGTYLRVIIWYKRSFIQHINAFGYVPFCMFVDDELTYFKGKVEKSVGEERVVFCIEPSGLTYRIYHSENAENMCKHFRKVEYFDDPSEDPQYVTALF